MKERLKDYVKHQLRLCENGNFTTREKELCFHNAFGAIELYSMVNPMDEDIRAFWSDMKNRFVQTITFIY